MHRERGQIRRLAGSISACGSWGRRRSVRQRAGMFVVSKVFVDVIALGKQSACVASIGSALLLGCIRVAPAPPAPVAPAGVGAPAASTTDQHQQGQDDEDGNVSSGAAKTDGVVADGSGEQTEHLDAPGQSDDSVSDAAPPAPPASAEVSATADMPVAASSDHDNESPSESPTTALPADRLVLLTAVGPLLVDLHVTIDGQAHRERFRESMSEIMELADSNRDDLVDWDELTSHPRFRYGQFGNPPSTTYEQRRNIVRTFDATQNDQVDPDELFHYLSSNQLLGRELSLVTSNWRRQAGRDHSPIRRWLDVNHDAVLDAEEIAGASRRLRLRDSNDDEILLPVDFEDYEAAASIGMSMRARSRSRGPAAATLLQQDMYWSDVRVAWQDRYSMGSSLLPEDLNLAAPLFQQMDVDRDGQLNDEEFESLIDVPAHVSLAISFRADGKSPSIEMTALRLPIESTRGVIAHQQNRLTVRLTDTTFDFSVSDVLGDRRSQDQVKSVMRAGDANQDGYLEEEEFARVQPQVGVAWEGVDANGDGKVYAQEVELMLEQRGLARRNRVVVIADDQEDVLVSVLDVNCDGRIDGSEVAQAPTHLSLLDFDEDGQIQLHELPSSMMLGVVRGADRPNAALAVPMVSVGRSESTPPWFGGMDRNGDGAIRWREFLGTRDQFQRLDRDGNSMVDVEEAVIGIGQ